MNKLYTLFTICLASVASLSHAQDVNITFNVNMANETVSDQGVYLAGGESFGVPGDNPMSDADEDGVWTITVQRPEGFTGFYTFTNGACADWGCKENIVGQDCASGEFNDRFIEVTTEDVEISTCFAACSSDGTCPAVTDPVSITFRVDMNELTLADTDVIYVTGGSIDSWCGTCNALTDDDMDGVYEITLIMPEGVHEYKYVLNAWGTDEMLDPAEDADCTLTTGDFTNRILTVGAEDQVLDINCFNACGACGVEVPTYDVTFKVDMSQVVEGFTTPEVNGTFNGWCGNCNPLTDEGDGVWSTTIALQEGSYDYKFSSDNWTIQEELTGVSGDCVMVIDGFTNRFVNVSGDLEVDLVCYASCAACAVSVTEISQTRLNVYPNPVENGTLYISGAVPSQLEIYNSVGLLTKIVNTTNDGNAIDVSSLSSGVYYLKDAKGLSLGTFVVNK